MIRTAKPNTRFYVAPHCKEISTNFYVVRGISLFNRARYKLIRFACEDVNIGCRRVSPRSFSTLLLLYIESDKPIKVVRGERVSPCQRELRELR